MIYGIGTDVCDLRRMAAAYARHGPRLAQRVLGAQELHLWQQRSARNRERGLRFLATRFSAKEAFSKAVGLGLRQPMSWRACEILNLPSGQPTLVLHAGLKTWFDARGLHAHVSMSDEADYAASFVLVEQRHPPAPCTSCTPP